ncbi:MAG: LysM peptidoglycan-binding domain-containing protein [Oscillospiraceae bacterium]|nr:LysM peptidoglycan-binding domain-containing protein [Oscillospiraceae bacterium]
MNCSNQVLYIIQPMDTLYDIAIRYNTTVEDIMARNTYLNPYNLIVGTQITICPNSKDNNMNMSGNFQNINMEIPKDPEISLKELELREAMNMLWSQHVYWTRLFLISVAENLNDLDATTKRLLRNPSDIANLYRMYYDENVAKKIETLLTEHLKIGGDLITALKNGNNALASELTQKWYKNADDMAEAFSSFNPNYNKDDLRMMLYTHLQLTTEEVAARLRKDYTAGIMAFDKVEQEALGMAKYFADGIIRQFPDMFR